MNLKKQWLIWLGIAVLVCGLMFSQDREFQQWHPRTPEEAIEGPPGEIVDVPIMLGVLVEAGWLVMLIGQTAQQGMKKVQRRRK